MFLNQAMSALICCLLAQTAVAQYQLPNVAATFNNTPKPFEINVDPKFIADVHQRVVNARAPIAINGPDNDGPPLKNFTTIKDYWSNTFDWNATQAAINKNLTQFTTVVKPANSTWNLSVPLHFVHHVSNRSDAIPLLFVHGWPGSFLEVTNIIDRLVNPPNASLPAFHVVAPSIPGFGFSPAPTQDGFGLEQVAQSFHSLMLQLNYPKYVAQGGDIGAFTIRTLAHLFPSNLISLHTNFFAIQPSPNDYQRLQQGLSTPDETTYINRISNYIDANSGYRFVQQTFPLALAYGTTDSPLGFALWIYNLMRNIVDPVDFTWTPQEIITFAMMHYIQGPYGAMRMYKEMQKSGMFVWPGFGPLPYAHQPMAMSEFPYDAFYLLPLSWAQREGNVKKRYVNTRGGHFAAYEVPELLAADVWDWFGDKELSGTDAFVH